MMSQKTVDSVKLETFDEFDDDNLAATKASNEAWLLRQASEFFGHDEWTHTGFRHDHTDREGLRTFAIFYDETPYGDDTLTKDLAGSLRAGAAENAALRSENARLRRQLQNIRRSATQCEQCAAAGPDAGCSNCPG